MQTSNLRTQTTPHVVIVGGGAGGLELATKLGHQLGRKNKAKITLIDKHQVHIWKPLLHEVATGSLDTEIDGIVYQAHSAKHGYHFQLGCVNALDCENKQLQLAAMLDQAGKEILGQRTIPYDTLVMAVGSISNDFGTPGITEHCALLDSKQQAQTFQQTLLHQFLKKNQSTDNTCPTRLAIVGGGATGVELSAELYHVIDVMKVYRADKSEKQTLSIDLIEAGPRILPALPERIAKSAARELSKLGVKIHTNTRVTRATKQAFIDTDGNNIAADILVWAAGVKVENWLSSTGLSTNKINQIKCHRTLKSESNDSVYAIGDCCGVQMPDGKPVPPRAQSAHQMASVAAKNIVGEINGKPLIEFTYKDYGSLVNLSRFATVGSLMGNLIKGNMFIEGKIARIMYLSLYRMHQLAIHGYFKGPFIIALSALSKVIRPKIKLH